MRRVNPNDIWIGGENWIEFVTPEGGFTDASSIDEALKPTLHFWKELETLCVKDCCGIDAFDLSPSAILDAANSGNAKDTADELLHLREEVLGLDAESVTSIELNQCFHCDVFLKVLDHMIYHVQKASYESTAS